jgi:hypothetical protein
MILDALRDRQVGVAVRAQEQGSRSRGGDSGESLPMPTPLSSSYWRP